MKDVSANSKYIPFIFAFIFIFASAAFSANYTTYQAKIVKPDGYPLEASSVNFKFTILDPSGSCILYSETYSTVNMNGTGGMISFSLGSGVKTYPASSPTFADIFNNGAASLSCDTGGPGNYSPGSDDTRKIVMQFHDGTGWQTLPAMTINAVPYAMYANDAKTLAGVSAANYVRYSLIPTCGVSEALHYNGAGFTCVALPNVGSFTAGDVASALSYTPANAASVTSLTSDLGTVSNTVSTVSSTVYAVSSTVNNLASSFSSFQNSVATSFAAITSSQWTTSGSAIFYNGNVGVGTVNPVTKLDVVGGLRISMEAAACSAPYAGTLRYNSGTVEYCNGTSWLPFGVAGAGITNVNGSTSGSQTFATGITGTVFNISSANGVHTFNIPLAASSSVTAGLLSNTDYLTFTNKLNATSAAVISALGYTPLNSSVSGTYVVKANNLSDLASATVARTNLGLGSLATLNYLDLGSALASGTLSAANLPSVGSGVTSGAQYTKVTVDGKGRVVSGAQLSSSDVVTALGYTPGAAASGVTSLNGSTSQTQTFANGSSGNAPAFNTSNGVHTLNIPLASATGSVTAGLISNADYTTFANKITSSAAAIAQVLGYTPASATALASYVVRSNNLSDLTSATVARANLGVGYIGTLTSVDLSSSDVTGTLAVARTPAYTGDVTKAAASSTFVLSNTGVTAGTYTKVTVDAKGRVTSGTSLTASDVNTALGYTAANSATVSALSSTVNSITSSQWTSSGSAIYYNAGNVGIGTMTPALPLHVYTSGTAKLRLEGTSGAANEYASLEFKSDEATDKNWLLSHRKDFANSFMFSYYDGSTWSNKVLITSGGSIGLGVTNPSAKLHIAAGTSSTAPLKITAGTLVSSAQDGAIEYDGTNLYYTDSTSTRRALASTSGGSGQTFSGTNNFTGVVNVSNNTASTNSSTGALVVSGGVGVGGALNVAGVVNFGSTLNVTGQISGSSRVLATGFRANQGVPDSNDSSTNGYAFGADGDTGLFSPGSGAANGVLTFYSNNSEKMRITSGGNVGIGTTTPSKKLEVWGSASVAAFNTSVNDHGYIEFYAEAANPTSRSAYIGYPSAGSKVLNIYSQYASGSVQLQNTAGSLILANTGNVGIGTGSPLSKLNISAPYSQLRLTDSDDGDFAAISYSGNMLAFRNNVDDGSTPIMAINDNGNVGIGTTAPAKALHVEGSMIVDAFTAGADKGIFFREGYTDTTPATPQPYNLSITAYDQSNSGSSNDSLSINANDGVRIKVAESIDALVVKSTGNIGVGTSSPTSLMHLSKSVTIGSIGSLNPNNGILRIQEAPTATLNMDGNTIVGTEQLIVGTKNAYDITLVTSDTSRMVITDTGQIGIATSTPLQKLHVENGNMVITGTAPAYQLKESDTVDTNWQIGINNGSLRFATQNDALNSSSEKVIITQAGNVGIGTTTPLGKLDVANATIRALDSATQYAPSGGRGLELFSLSGTGYVFNYDRTTSTYLPMRIDGSSVSIGNSGTTVVNVSGGGVGIGVTPNASYKLDVLGDIYVGSGGSAQKIQFRTANTDGGFIRFNSTADTPGGSSLEIGTIDNSDEPILFTQTANERMRIHTNGYVGIGTAAPTTHLAVNSTTASGYTIISNKNAAAGGQEWRWYSSSTGAPLGTDSMCFGTGACVLSLYTSGNATLAGTLTQSSDVRLKRDISSIPSALDAVTKLEGVTYYWKDSAKDPNKQLGLIAQNVEKVFPEAVKTNAQGFKSVAYQNLIAPVIEAVKELFQRLLGVEATIKQQSQEIEMLKTKSSQLEEQNKALKDYLCEKDPNAKICK